MNTLILVLSLLAMALFYGCYFWKMIIQRRKGIQTDHMGKGKEGFVKFVEVSLKTVTILIPIAELASIILYTKRLPTSIRLIGCALALLGAIVFVISVLTMKDSWRAGVSESEKTELVTDGIYRFSRNPAFLGFDLLYIGVLLAYFNIPLLVLTVIGMVLFHLQIVNVEEDFLIVAFGDAYKQYQAKVCRYFGRKITVSKRENR